MMRNSTLSDNSVLEAALGELAGRLADGWQTDVEREPQGDASPDAIVRVTSPDSRSAMLAVETKGMLDPKDVERTVSRPEMRRRRDQQMTPVVVAPYLGERTRERLRELGAGYVDLTGNIYLRLDEPSVFIDRTGATTNPTPRERPARSLKGAKAARLVRALIDFQPPLGVRKLAELARIDPGYASRLLDMLEREDIVKRERRGPIEDVDWPALLRLWTKDYSLMTSNRTLSFLQPRGLPKLMDSLREGALPEEAGRYATTGSLAAARLAPVAPARLGVIYVDRIDRAPAALGLVPAETGANVLLARPFDEVVFARSRTDEGLVYCAPSQVAADLLTSPGRGPEEAEALIDWMAANEKVWRDQ